ncbi:MAG: hypothetical protein AAF092_10385 [Pseudomonadota bacterium]
MRFYKFLISWEASGAVGSGPETSLRIGEVTYDSDHGTYQFQEGKPPLYSTHGPASMLVVGDRILVCWRMNDKIAWGYYNTKSVTQNKNFTYVDAWSCIGRSPPRLFRDTGGRILAMYDCSGSIRQMSFDPHTLHRESSGQCATQGLSHTSNYRPAPFTLQSSNWLAWHGSGGNVCAGRFSGNDKGLFTNLSGKGPHVTSTGVQELTGLKPLFTVTALMTGSNVTLIYPDASSAALQSNIQVNTYTVTNGYELKWIGGHSVGRVPGLSKPLYATDDLDLIHMGPHYFMALPDGNSGNGHARIVKLSETDLKTVENHSDMGQKVNPAYSGVQLAALPG